VEQRVCSKGVCGHRRCDEGHGHLDGKAKERRVGGCEGPPVRRRSSGEEGEEE
jgi:hypothetical protein